MVEPITLDMDARTPTLLHSTAIDLGAGRTAVAVSAYAQHTCAILDNGDVKCWGRQKREQLGDGGVKSAQTTPQNHPLPSI